MRFAFPRYVVVCCWLYQKHTLNAFKVNAKTMNIDSPKKTNSNKFIRRKGQPDKTTTSADSSTASISNHEKNSTARNGFPTPPLMPGGSNNSGNRIVARQTLDTTYPPNIQPDYGGKIFSHQYSCLRQLPVYDVESNLVPTDQLWNYLRPGTLIMLNTDLICWIYDDEKCCKVGFSVYKTSMMLSQTGVPIAGTSHQNLCGIVSGGHTSDNLVLSGH